MTVPATARRAGPYTGTGTQTAFPFGFRVFSSTDVRVALASAGVEVTLTPGTQYTVAINPDQDTTPGGTVNVATAPAVGQTLAIVGGTPYTQTLDLPAGGNYSPIALENALDRMVFQTQRLAEEQGRALTLPATNAGASTVLPVPEAGSIIGWDDTAEGLRNVDPATLASIVAYANWVADAFQGDGTTAVFALTRDPGSVYNTDVSIAGVTLRPVFDYNVSGTLITFASAPPAAIPPASPSNVLVRYGQALPQGMEMGDLLSVANAGKGAGLIGYLASLAYARGTIGAKLREIPSVRDTNYAGGAVGDGTTLDTAAMAAAHATGAVIHYPPGRYKFTPPLIIPAGGIVGAGPLTTTLYCDDTGTGDLIRFTGALGSYSNIPVFHGFTLETNPAKSGGAGLQFAPASGETSYADIRNVHTLFCPIGIDFVAASLWKVIGCDFLSYSIAGIQVANTNVADSGDSVVFACVFNNPYTTGSGIWQKSSGGLKIKGNKFLGGARGYTMALEGSTSVLIISGNSFENMSQQDIVLAQQTGGTAFVNVCITGNEFSVGGVAIATDATGFLSEVNISANQINMGATGSNPCISLDSVTDFFVGSNIIKGNGGASSTAITINNCANGKVAPNTYANLPTPLSITSSPTVSVALDTQSGTGATASSGWSTYGVLYLSPATTITFPRAFLMTPSVNDVSVEPTSANGEVGSVIVSVSKTQLVVRIVSAVNLIGAAFKWSVGGVL